MPANTDSKAKILEAAVDLLREGGSGYLRIDAVADHAGVNKRMIYHHYGDRLGLISAVFQYLVEICRTRELHGSVVDVFEQAFGALGTEFTLKSDLDSREIIRLLSAEYLRMPRDLISESKDLLTLLGLFGAGEEGEQGEEGEKVVMTDASDEQEPGAKPVFRLPSASRPANRAR